MKADPARLRNLTQGPDTGTPRLWDYQGQPAEDSAILSAQFWSNTNMRVGALVQIYGDSQFATNIFVLTPQGLAQSGLDVFLDRIAGSPPVDPERFKQDVRTAMCDLLGCGG